MAVQFLRRAVLVLLVVSACDPVPALAQTIRTFAGTGTAGYSGDGGQADSARFNSPVGVHGNNAGQIWVADTGNHRIRRVTPSADSVVTYAGTGTASYTGDGAAATAATLNAPTDVFVDSTGNVWVADTGNHVIRRITTAGVISTVAGTGVAGYSGDDSTATVAKLNSPAGVYVTNAGVIYIADRSNHRVRRVSTAGVITTIAGTGTAGFSGDGGPATSARLNSPSDVFVDTAGVVYVVDTNNHRLRAIAADSTITTIAGTGSAGFSGDGGVATSARLAFPRSVFVDTSGSVYIADRFNHRVRRINTSGNITTLAGTGSLGASGDGKAANIARLGSPGGVWLHDTREMFIGDGGNHRIRRIDDDNVRGISGATTSGTGREIRVFSAAFTGDGATAVKGLRINVSDLTTATGLDTSDFLAFRLYESPDSLFSVTDTLLGSLAGTSITLGTPFTVQATPSPVPAAGQRRHYIMTAAIAPGAVEGHAFRVGFTAGGLSTSIGGHGMQVRAANADKITVDVVATKLLFATQPDGAISSNPLVRQPVVRAVDDLGYTDGDFTDVVTLSVSGGSGSLLQATATAVSGIATFSSVTYVAASDQEPFALIADDETGGAEGDLPTTTSNTMIANTQNNAPVVVALNFTINEDDSVTVPITSMVSDVDDSLSTLLFEFTASHSKATLTGTQLTIRPDLNYFGPDTLRITAEDPFGAVGSDLSVLNIKSVNDRPVLTRLGRRTIAEDETLVVDLRTHVTDVETPFSGMAWSFVPSTGLTTTFTKASGLLRARTAPNASGQYTLRITAFDAEGLAATTFDTIDVTPVNDAPVWALPKTISIARDSTLVLQLSPFVSDVDHSKSSLKFQLGSTTGMTASLTGSTLSATPAPGFSGPGQVVIHATDPGGAVGTATLQVNIFSPMPQAPIVSPIAQQIIELGDTLRLELDGFVADPDHADALLTWSVSAPTKGSATITNRILTVVTAGNTPYTATMNLTATDPDNLAASTTLSVQVVELLPLLLPMPDSLQVEITGGELLLDTFVRPGIAAATVNWTAVTTGDLDVVIHQATRIVTIGPSGGSRAGGRVQFTATSPKQSATDSIAIHIANVTPVLSLPDLFLDAGESAQLLLDDFATDDEDVSLLTWAATPLDAGLTVSLNQSVRAVTLSAAADASGDLSVAFSATDAQGAVGLDTLVLTVHAPADATPDPDSSQVDTTGTNIAPSVGPYSVLTFLAGTVASLNLDDGSTDDQDIAQLSWSADAGAGVTATIDSDRRLTVQAAEGFTGTTSIRLTATDIFGARGSATLVVEVRAQVVSPAAGDFNGSGRVDLDDFFALVDQLGRSVFSPGFDGRFDLNNDGRVGFDDFFIFLDLYEAHRLVR